MNKQNILDYLYKEIKVSEIEEQEISPIGLLKHYISEDAQEDLYFLLLEAKKQKEKIIKIVNEVEKVNESNGRYNACCEILEKIKKL